MPKLMDPDRRLEKLRKAAYDALGQDDRSWMIEPGEPERLLRGARQTQHSLVHDVRTFREQHKVDIAVRELEGLCFLVEEFLRSAD